MMPDSPAPSPGKELGELLRVAVDVFTAAAKVTQWPLRRGSDGHLEADQHGQPHRVSWSEFVGAAVAGAAANLGGSREILADRPHASEDPHIKALLLQVLGPDDEDIACHRTEALDVTLYVRAILADLAYQLAAGEDSPDTAVQHLESHLDMQGLCRNSEEPPPPWTGKDSDTERILLPIGEAMKSYLLSSNTLCHCPISVHIEPRQKPATGLFGGAPDTITERLIQDAADAEARPWLADQWAAIPGRS
ncbi:Helix-turn-helix protein [Mycobacteroides abscessus subsp. abscessus]|nr:Helix-turn-helix protein [Mycobacteroides abscessus subsp. abscessus]